MGVEVRDDKIYCITRCYTHAIQVFGKYSALFFLETKRNRKEIEKYIILFASGRGRKLINAFTFFFKIRERMLVCIAKWARMSIPVRTCDEREDFNPQNGRFLYKNFSCVLKFTYFHICICEFLAKQCTNASAGYNFDREFFDGFKLDAYSNKNSVIGFIRNVFNIYN